MGQLADKKEGPEIQASQHLGERVSGQARPPSPGDVTIDEGASRLTQATATFDHIRLQGSDKWTGTSIGTTNGAPALSVGSFTRSGETFTVTGSGDVAPAGSEEGWTIGGVLIGAVVALIVVIFGAIAFITPERSAERKPVSPQRGRVLAARAVVIGLVTFTTQLMAAPLCQRYLNKVALQL